MAVTIQINGVTLIPQPAETVWEPAPIAQKLDGTDGLGAYWILTIKAPVTRGGTCNWYTYDNTVLSSIKAHAPGDTMRGTEVTYNSGVVSKPIMRSSAPPGGLVHDIEMVVLVVV